MFHYYGRKKFKNFFLYSRSFLDELINQYEQIYGWKKKDLDNRKWIFENLIYTIFEAIRFGAQILWISYSNIQYKHRI